MSSLLKNILKEYEIKRLTANIELENKKKEFYALNPRLEEIDLELSNVAISTSKMILSYNNPKLLSDLEKKINALKKEKENILISLKKEPTFLEPSFDCNICNDTGYITKNYSSKMCNCLKQRLLDIEYNNSNLGNLKKENFDSFDLTLYSDKLDNTNISPRENISIIKEISLNFINNFDSPEEKNLLFTGTTGLGKTFLSNCIANEILNKGKTVLYQTAPIMLDNIIEYKFGRKDFSISYDSILDSDLLIIDDLGTEGINSMKFTELFNILNSRLLLRRNKVTKTILSTNLTIQELLSTYDERIVSRIRGYYKICPFFGDDIRIIKNNRKLKKS